MPTNFLRTLYLSLRDTGRGGISCSFLQGTLTLSWLLQCTQRVWPSNHSLPEAIERLGTLVEHREGVGPALLRGGNPSFSSR